MRQITTKASAHNKINFFLFSVEYLVLTFLIYSALLSGPYAIVADAWDLGLIILAVIPICIWLLYLTLDMYFKTSDKPPKYASKMTVLTLFPPVIGPIIVLLRSLE